MSVAMTSWEMEMPPVLALKEAPDLRELVFFAAVREWAREDKGLRVLGADGSETRVSVLAPDLVRVRASGGKPLDPLDFSWAIEKTEWEKTPFEIEETESHLWLRTSRLDVGIEKEPFRISFYDRTTGQVVSSDFSPMRYHPSGSKIALMKRLGFDEHFYGFGEKAARLDRRRSSFTMWNSDRPGYTEGTDPLYQSIPFYMGLEKGRGYGLFFDNSYKTRFDMGYSLESSVVMTAEGGEIDYYFFLGPSLKDVLSRYTELTGRMPLPPLWALGHQQSRWSYYPESNVEQVVARYREAGLPLDALHLDIDYMDGYRVFTWDENRFPDPAGLVSRLKAQGVRVVTILDPGVKHEPGAGYAVFESGRELGHFLARPDGSLYVGRVWPGESVFVDYTKDDARKWWGDLHKGLVDAGVAGFWNDMNEPADFDDPDGTRQADVVSDDRGRFTPHAKNRNVFGLLMARSTFEGLQRLRPEERPFVLTRAGYAGIQRYAAVWTGDNVASWDALKLSLPMFQSLGLSGVPFVGSDIGGFMSGDADGELMVRWYQVASLTPFCRNHRSRSGYDQEPFRYPSFYQSLVRESLERRYRWLPYLYTVLEEACRTGQPFFRPLVLEYQDDPDVVSLDGQFLVGRDLLAAPVFRPGQTEARVYLPEGEWVHATTRRRYPGKSFPLVAAPLEEMPIFHRAGSIFPSGPGGRHVEEKAWSPLTLDAFPDKNGEARGVLYEDDGQTVGGPFRRTRFFLKREGAGWSLRVETEGGFATPKREWAITVHREEGAPLRHRFADTPETKELSQSFR
jgi:alpha-glucosidase